MALRRSRAFPTSLLAGYAGFIAGRHGELAWPGTDDAWRFGVLAGSAALGVALSRIGRPRRRPVSPVGDSLQRLGKASGQ
jgi:hypothetical protein